MIVRLGGTAGKAGVRANAGKPVTGAGRLAGDPTRVSPDRPL
jgi:cytochrome c